MVCRQQVHGRCACGHMAKKWSSKKENSLWVPDCLGSYLRKIMGSPLQPERLPLRPWCGTKCWDLDSGSQSLKCSQALSHLSNPSDWWSSDPHFRKSPNGLRVRYVWVKGERRLPLPRPLNDTAGSNYVFGSSALYHVVSRQHCVPIYPLRNWWLPLFQPRLPTENSLLFLIKNSECRTLDNSLSSHSLLWRP